MTYVAGLKKAYTTFQHGIKLYMADQGLTNLSQTDLFNKDGDTDFESSTTRQAVWDSVMRNYFKVIKSCNVKNTSCIIKGSYLTETGTNYEFGDSATKNNNYNFFTADGIGFEIYPNKQWACIPDYDKIGSMKDWCANVNIDINGTKPPNKIGRDYFEFELGSDGNLHPNRGMAWAQYANGDIWQIASNYWQNFQPWGCGDQGNPIIPSETTGDGCAARIMENGWQMDY